MTKWTIAKIVLLAAFSVLVLANSMIFKSFEIGIPASSVVFYISSVAAGDAFFYKEKRFLKTMLGLATVILIMTVLGTFLILVSSFYEAVSLVSLVAVGLVLCLFSVFKKSMNVKEPSHQMGNGKTAKKESYLLLFPFLLSVTTALYALLSARTGEGQVSVWLTVPNFFLPSFFISTLSLMLILFFTEMSVGLKLTLVSVYSFLSHSIFLLVWYPMRYGDQWTYLGHARYVDSNGAFYAHEHLFSGLHIADIVRYKSQYALVVFLRRMFTFDIYWVNVLIIPVLWSLFAPIFSYKIAETLMSKKSRKFPLFCAICTSLFPTLIYWGAIATTFSLGLLFLLFSILLVLGWVDSGVKRFLFLSLLASIATLFAHPTIGIFSLALFFVAVLIKSTLHSVLKIILIAPTFVIYPIVSYLQNATFSLQGLLDPKNFLSFQSSLVTLLLVFGFLGWMFSIRGGLVKTWSAIVLFLLYVITAVNYYVSMYGMMNAIVPERLTSVMDLFILPFVAFGLALTVNFLRIGFSRIKGISRRNPVSARAVSMALICLFFSLVAMSALYQAYPRDEITKVQPAAYEVEAVEFLDSTTPTRYTVLGDTNLATVAAGMLGIDYSYGTAKGNFGLPAWSSWPQKLYLTMTTKPSLTLMEQAIAQDQSSTAYFVVSVREGKNFQDIVLRTSEVIPFYKVFGDGKLYVFKYPFEGVSPGSIVKVTFDDGTSEQAHAAPDYTDWSDVKYTVYLSGHSSYNISDYPKYWTFLNLTVNNNSAQFDNSSDINSFIYLRGVDSEDSVEVTWHANNLYRKVGWKDDSFMYGWQPRASEGIKSPSITTDGNILSLSWNFTPGQYQYYYYMKPVSVSTIDYQYIFVRWRSTGPVAYVTINYASGPQDEAAIVRINGESSGWTVTKQRLWADTSTAFVTVGITNLNNKTVSGPQTLYVDYIMICGTD